MRHALSIALAAGALAAVPLVAVAEIVKLVDPSGRIIYADRAVKGARLVGTVDSEPPVAAAKPASAKSEAPRADAARAVPTQVETPKSDVARLEAAKPVAPTPEPSKQLAKVDPRAAAKSGPSSARQEIRWMATEPDRQRSMNSAYTELEAATTGRETAERELREAVLPRSGETVQLADGNVRYLPIYYERIAPFERAAMLANDRYERAQSGFRFAR